MTSRNDLLLDLYDARRRVAALEDALSQLDALQGTGVGRESKATAPSSSVADLAAFFPYLAPPEEDISNFLGREGHEESRPQLGPDAPPELRPKGGSPLSPLVSLLVERHPDDALLPGAHWASGLHIPEYCSICEQPLSEDCLRSCPVLALVSEGLWIWNLRTKKVYASHYWQSLMGAFSGRLQDDARDGSPLDAVFRRVHPEDLPAFRAQCGDLLAGRVRALSLDLRVRQDPDAWIWGELRAVNVLANGETGEVVRLMAVLRDITLSRRMMEEIRLNESRFAALYRLSHMDDVPEEEVIRFSLEHLLQFSDSELGYLYVGGMHDAREDRVYWCAEALARFKNAPPLPPACSLALLNSADGRGLREAVFVNEGSAELIFGKEIAVRRHMFSPLLENGRVVCVAAVANKDGDYERTDLLQLERFVSGVWFTLRRRWATKALQRAKEAAEKANSAKNEFLANVSHELRTPLNGMLGMLQLLQQSQLATAQMQYVVMAYHSGRSLLRIISDILDFSKIEAGRFTLTPRLFDFPATVRATLGMFIHQAKQKDLRFSLDMDENIPDLLFGDDIRVRQIIFNLVGNAFKFTEKGEVGVVCSLLPHHREDSCRIYLAVKDTGIGIPDDRLEHIFQAFTQIDGSSTRSYSGTGLGLAIVRKLVSLMGGAMSVESTLGKGTSIHCSLPFASPKDLPESAVTPRLEAKSAAPLNILVVEDDLVSQFALRSLLKKLGHSCVCVGNGRLALETLLLLPFDCIITDIQMPVMDGMELVSRIRSGNTAAIEPGPEIIGMLKLGEQEAKARFAIAQDIPIVALTAHAIAGDRERFLGMGMDYYIAKPVFAAELSAVLGHIGMLLYAHKNP